MSSIAFLSSLKEGTTEWVALRNSIVEGNLYFAYTVAGKYERLCSEATSIASEALIKAVEDYAKNGNGSAFLPYAKAVICHAIQRRGITPSIKCGIVGGLNPINKKHNAETNARRAENGLEALQPVLVTSAETEERENEDGKMVSLFDVIPSEVASPLEEAMKSEEDEARDATVSEVLARFDDVSNRIWQLRTEKSLDWKDIAPIVGMNKSTVQMRFYSMRDKVQAALA